MKVWHCRYMWHGNSGAFQYYDCIVVAEIKSKALGMALMEYPNTKLSCWDGVEIDITKENVERHENTRAN